MSSEKSTIVSLQALYSSQQVDTVYHELRLIVVYPYPHPQVDRRVTAKVTAEEVMHPLALVNGCGCGKS